MTDVQAPGTAERPARGDDALSTPSVSQAQTPDELEADIELRREQLAATIDALATRLDVKAQARDKVAEVRNRATDDAGRPRPEVVAGAAAAVLVLVGLVWWRRS